MSRIPKDLLGLLNNKNSTIDKNFKKNLKTQLFSEETAMTKKSFKVSSIGQNFKKMKLGTGLAALALLLVVGTVSAGIGSDRTRLASEKKVEIPANLNDVLSVNDIREKALAQVPGGVITGVELENEHGVLLYKVKFNDGSFRLFNAKTGELFNKSTGIETDDSVPAGFAAQVDLSAAREIAQKQRPGKSINKVELETENGTVVYSFRFSDGGRVDVNASNGSVVRVRDQSSSGSTSSSSVDDNDDDKSGSSGSSSSSDDNSGSGSQNSDDDNSHSGSNSGSGSDDSSDDN